MKKILSLLAMLVAVQFSYAQFTTSGTNTTTINNVGIGTTSPESGFNIDVNGLGTIGTQASARLYMGTTDATHAFIQSRDNSINQNLTFDAASYNFAIGNVGIGTTSPTQKLDVSGKIRADYLVLSGNLGVASNTDARIYMQNTTSGTGQNWNIISDVDGSFSTGIYGNTPFQTIQSNGNVGIGTTSPANKLQIGSVGSSGYDNNAIAAGDGTNVIAMHYGATGYLVANGNLALGGGTNTSSQLFLQSSGNVGIGTTDPQGHKLAVNGDIIATKVTVKPYGNWPDYVFKPTYNLPSLSEVKTYIDQNQHLPDMPSAATVEKDGQDIGEMNKLLLKKVEELTLYMIEKDKEVKDQDKEIKELKDSQQKQIDDLKSQVSQLLNRNKL